MSDCHPAESVIAKDRSRLCCMAVVVEMHNNGNPEARVEVVALIEHALSDRSGDWRVIGQ
jgi:hypothetical protein